MRILQIVIALFLLESCGLGQKSEGTPKLEDGQCFREWYLKGENFINNNDHKKAIDAFNQALECANTHLDSCNTKLYLLNSLIHSGDNIESSIRLINNYQISCGFPYPSFSVPMYIRNVYFVARKYQLALEFLDQALLSEDFSKLELEKKKYFFGQKVEIYLLLNDSVRACQFVETSLLNETDSISVNGAWYKTSEICQ